MRPASLVAALALFASMVLSWTGVGANATSSYTLIVEPQVDEAGASVQATGRGYDKPGEVLNLRLDKLTGPRLANVTVDKNGTFSSAATIPVGTEPGPHQIIVCRTSSVGDCVELAAASIRVVTPPDPTPEPSPDPTDEPPPPDPTLGPPEAPPQDETVPLLTPTPPCPMS